MKWLLTAVAVVGLGFGGTARAADGRGPSGSAPAIVVDNSGNGQGNRLTVDPRAGERVTIKDSGNGRNNSIVVAPDPRGTVVINASANGRGNRIVVEEAPGEHVVIRGSANGRNNNVVIEKVPGPGRPAKPTPGRTGHQSRR